MTARVPLLNPIIRYPDSDGQPMAESDFQRVPLIYAVEALTLFFQDASDVYVSGNMFLYYQEGDVKSVVAPDVFVVFGVPKVQRRSFRLWEEGKAPDFILEITSDSTRTHDQGIKRGLYAYLGVREYFQYDPTGDYLDPPLQGFRLQGQSYDPIPTQSLNGSLAAYSEVLGLELRVNVLRREFRFYNPRTKRMLPSYIEAEVARQNAEAIASAAESRAAEAEDRVIREAAARRAVEEENERLRAELARLRSQGG